MFIARFAKFESLESLTISAADLPWDLDDDFELPLQKLVGKCCPNLKTVSLVGIEIVPDFDKHLLYFANAVSRNCYPCLKEVQISFFLPHAREYQSFLEWWDDVLNPDRNGVYKTLFDQGGVKLSIAMEVRSTTPTGSATRYMEGEESGMDLSDPAMLNTFHYDHVYWSVLKDQLLPAVSSDDDDESEEDPSGSGSDSDTDQSGMDVLGSLDGELEELFNEDMKMEGKCNGGL